MARSNTFRVTGHRDAARRMDNIRRASEGQLSVGMNMVAQRIAASAKRSAPVKTGTLRRSIVAKRER